MLHAVIVLAGLLSLVTALRAQDDFSVHEWGVWVRKDILVTRKQEGLGDEIKDALPERVTNLAPACREFEELPEFVLRHDTHRPPRVIQSNSWTKPVLHFYGPEGLQVRVVVQTAEGRPTAYWPPPKLKTTMRGLMGAEILDPDILIWKGVLKAAPPENLKRAPEGHWWSVLRKVPGMYWSGDDASERIIFYEGTGKRAPNIAGVVGENEVTLTNRDETPSGRVVAIFNDGRQLFVRSVETIKANESFKLAKAEWLAAPGGAKGVLAAAQEQWRSYGMTHEEATAIVEACTPELTHTLGFLIVYRLPSAAYEKLFPIDIKPAPRELVRAGVIFDTLPGEKARAAWLPILTEKLEDAAKDLGHVDYERREAARKRLAAFGDLAAPFLEKLKASTDAEVRSTASALLDAATKPVKIELKMSSKTMDFRDFMKNADRESGYPPGSPSFKGYDPTEDSIGLKADR